jgi:hypothetical protein
VGERQKQAAVDKHAGGARNGEPKRKQPERRKSVSQEDKDKQAASKKLALESELQELVEHLDGNELKRKPPFVGTKIGKSNKNVVYEEWTNAKNEVGGIIHLTKYVTDLNCLHCLHFFFFNVILFNFKVWLCTAAIHFCRVR